MDLLVSPLGVAEWEAVSLPQSYRAEIIQGELVVTPSPSAAHGRVQTDLILLFGAAVPDGYGPVAGVEWRLEVAGVIAMAPQPDVMVVPCSTQGRAVTAAPLLAVEVLSRSDHQRLANGLTRRDGKLADYAANGLADYLEVDLTADELAVVRYELRDAQLVEVERATKQATLKVERPFPYEISPAAWA